MKIERSGFTKTGFSRNFGCCGHWQYCNMGKGKCFYEKLDPDAMKGCSTWQRNHVATEPKEVDISVEETKTLINSENVDFKQLSLFD